MALTRDFKELVQKRIVSDPAFGEALLREGIDTMLAGDIDTEGHPSSYRQNHATVRRPNRYTCKQICHMLNLAV
jgi:hypothetical protein